MLGTFYYLQKFLRLSVIVSFNLPICSLKNEDDGPVASFSNRDRLGILFTSNHNIHNNLYGLLFLDSEPFNR